ncbi:MAG: histidine kinase [Alphaproteobacteria bacterium CG_4_10_14_0_2_um_filter_63_37]|nr:MAG: hypothetical protein AUJ55_01275 [Proteobacteria bacterium CG1_02_64_396]PJA26001.1 MAG: histidine kinase [Alphaproteobacteria bacterium CG_4_10_14_0_2_um_filter_63_37]
MTATCVSLPHIDAALIEAELRRLRAQHPQGGGLVLLPEEEQQGVATIQQAFRAAQVPLAGAIFPALIWHNRFTTQGGMLLWWEQAPPFALLDLSQGDVAQQATTITAPLMPHIPETGATLLLIFDAMLPSIAAILDGLYLVLADRVHYTGVNAGSETFQPTPCLFDDERLIGNGALAMLVPRHHDAVLAHGYRPPETMIAATATEGNRIVSIDWRPAFEVYREQVLAQFGVELTTDNFYQYGVHFPFGIMLADGEILVRIPVALTEDGALFCVGEVPPHAILTLLHAPQASSLHTAEELAEGIKGWGAPEKQVLTFYCAGRRMHLGLAGAEQELADLARLTGRTLAGALSLGEIGSAHQGGYPLFQNATIVCLLP